MNSAPLPFRQKIEKIKTKDSLYINNVILRKYFNKFPTGSWAEANTLVNSFIMAGRSKSYCESVLKRLITHHKRLNPNYTSPLASDKGLITTAYQNIIKLQNSRHQLYDENGRPVQSSFGKRILKYEPIPIINLNILYIHSTAVLLCAFNRQLLTPQVLTNKQLIAIEFALVIYIIFHTGARVGEIFNLTVGDARGLMANKSIKILCKGKMDRFVIPKLVAEKLKQFVERRHFSSDSDFLIRPVWTRSKNLRTRGFMTAYFNQVYRHLFKQEKPLSTGFHNYRHYFAFRTTDRGFAQAIMRHKSAKTFNHYKSIYEQQRNFDY
ncbi:MAG: site-specific integrase [Janthinobacterium lividum]